MSSRNGYRDARREAASEAASEALHESSGVPLSASVSAKLRDLPKVDKVLRRPEIEAGRAPRWAVVAAVRQVIEERRQAILAGTASTIEVDSMEVLRRAEKLAKPSLGPVINATGVVLHTNLGRAPLGEEAVRRMAELARSYSNLEYDTGAGSRSSRQDHLQALLCRLTGAESALVVNNNAAAVLVSLAALAAGREVVVSRGELVEIGGSFRIPDVMRASGARIVEVGTTNKTHQRDYELALGCNDCALVLKVHRSNFAVVGFTAEVVVSELAALAGERGVPLMVDLGSGTMANPTTWCASLPAEPTVPETVAAGADLVTFSGDKLLGGPQAGIVVGASTLVARIAGHPLIRAVRPDKLTLAALEATLEAYRDGHALEQIPVVRMLAASQEELNQRARTLRTLVFRDPGLDSGLEIDVVQIDSAVGGGALPLASLPSWALSLAHRAGCSAAALGQALRRHVPPVVGRIVGDRLLLDVRTIAPAELEQVAAAIRTLPDW
ncbi:MAG: L-seryl-tRNA(Sec) selenium transferase [Pseudomonadota bacterium]